MWPSPQAFLIFPTVRSISTTTKTTTLRKTVSMPSSSSQKRAAKGGSTRHRKKPRTVYEELTDAAEVLRRSLGTGGQQNSDLATLGAIVDKIIAGDSTSEAILKLLSVPVVLTGDVLPQPRSSALADGQRLGPNSAERAQIINGDRVKLAKIYHSVLFETSTHESNYEEEFAKGKIAHILVTSLIPDFFRTRTSASRRGRRRRSSSLRCC